ncbi:asialoglycoprotein receptor 1-like [Hyperolius riggenbachi]|uniref:asialoglycoprotein receptor 1-like n=1 Tax=Hyperolius riggenbachi TaxID=752182 RepID=UPI0035A352A9
MTSRVSQLSQDGSKTMERIKQLTDALHALKADLARDSGEKLADRSLEYRIGNLSDSVSSKVSRLSQDGSKLLEKLQDVDNTLRAIQANISTTLGDKSRDRSLENVIGNLSVSMNSAVSQLTQDGTKMMEILDQMNNTLSVLQANTSTGTLQSEMSAVLSELIRLSEEVKRLKVNDSCPSGWKGFRSSCYIFSSPTRTWSDAKLKCENIDSNLVVINTAEEQKFLLELTQKRNAWIGLMYRPHTWTWVDGISYNLIPTNWAIGKPNPYMYGYNACAYMGSDGKWQDVPCSQTFSSLCEKDML